MAWYDWAGAVPAIYSGISHAVGGKGLSGDAQDAWNWGKQRSMAPQMGQSPYQGSWDALIGQLQLQGNSTPMADNAFRQAKDNAMQQSLAMSRGGSAGGARQAGMSLAQANNGIMGNYANAKLQEQMMARQSLMGALGGAGQSWWGPQNANFQAQLSTPSNMQMLTDFMQKNLGTGAKMAGGGF